ncbi:hybrid sensor histidine kinase/response regulator [Aetokthonos hydrillicola Thurmond2011]|jgi:signal transduction histidine kinase|uniref:histidine kinase n=1 Tax=Aetokthonos hydrillicola Thurmond2011 TaxID=2712845 RepID=A0AAP5I230_9CYAN|nr:hybrid sensor histidine kinase/response regulator [Aetokthonos hydrillicola]MBO3462697.1 response regulator [Aetokthonos hydrillicola CCALA 1050]MBW4588069.1 hybrid sensor histidine kinase/response regulator [Aetokthonos hydrillicola CCALA 1050]MDR9893384.1 hybrid sensor histidine kinase/response regulator [Aetokthonos hydrillicola Thurmond2011]
MEAQPCILVIDDEPDNFDVIETLLDGENYHLDYSPSSRKALARLRSFQPDIILLDVMMPEMDGMEVCRRIKGDPRLHAIPIIMLTALTAKEDLAKCLGSGADDFISKPVNSLELRSRIRSMLRIKQHYDQLQALLKLREDMVNMIVHDLRNPLGSIFLSTDILRLPDLPSEHYQRNLEQLGIAAQQLQSLIDSLLLMAKLESGRMTLNYTDVDLCALCTSAVSDMEAIAAQKNLTVVSQLPKPGGVIKADAAIFRRVLDNLLSNAIKFSPSNSQLTLRADYLEVGGAKVQVADSGPGVPHNLRQSIFEKYEIGTLMQEVSQLGLGLAFCKMAVKAHQGTITVEDNYPRGSIFTILLEPRRFSYT